MLGTVKFYNQQKGFGFITPKDGGKDVFFHFTNIDDNNKDIEEDEKVEFDTEQTAKGIAAIRIRRV